MRMNKTLIGVIVVLVAIAAWAISAYNGMVGVEEEATTALVMLGFSKANIAKVMPAILKENPSAKVEDIIKAALKRL